MSSTVCTSCNSFTAASVVDSLYIDHHIWLINWLSKRVSNHSDAEDLAHNTFLRILNRPHTDPINTPRGYLKTIAHGLVVNFYRRSDLEAAYLELLASKPTELMTSPEQFHETLECLVEISLLLDGLPDKAKAAYLMVQVEGLKYKDVAKELSVSASSVKKYMFKAGKHCLALRAQWRDQGCLLV